ncbi:astacin [Ancylostoma duodenale]|uniref:Metalloendopeptidase n=1 Tax=Ancylostoma duodenale TaxID=51022 RepID=A0A0C2FTH9_9BILA|nr:astacin [Ancylostoma duodenale]
MLLGKGCDVFGHATHEIGHALGLHHAQNRYDRNEHIEIIQKNIPKTHEQEFELAQPSLYATYGLPYDYGSIMHYGSNRDKPQLVLTKPNYWGTMGRCDRFSTQCKNGGFKHPRDCNRCICPSGYGGRLCDELPEGLGEIMNAISDWRKFSMTQQHYLDNDLDYMMSTFWIKVSEDNFCIIIATYFAS